MITIKMNLVSNYLKPVLFVGGLFLVAVAATGLWGWLIGLGTLGTEMVVLALLIDYDENH